MHTQTTQTKRFAQHVKCCQWYYEEIDLITNDAYLTDEERLAALDELEDKILTLAAPFLAVATTIKTTMEILHS
ncbi:MULTISPECIES: hypothetical protein [Enterobacteriaceae]|uniref:hypothetical protein n=1 Tax=Enterobacteriaceae TaxID=543 RepID=UPI0015FC3C60|nr:MULTISPECIES: hypothetical protein [Enterobacteriaceae]HAU5662144.1 hypothetical protein [Citrobacter freundii]MCX9057531.1 hypothetical protein [Citrobacter portucalensis]HCB2475086.1 hypothetical protein [Citrobacter freundii]HDQ2969060.1 hypothetical protein [Citrobacter freundii]HEG1963225.1 hypothetical protein [Citrobacter freundii]